MSGLRIGRIFGIDIYLHGSWLIIAALVMWSLASAALPSDFPEVGGGTRLAMAGAITLLFFLSLLAHELAHSVVAMARGIPVHRITFFLFGGMAETSKESRSPGEEFFIAIAGPAASFLLAALFFMVWYLGQGAGWSPLLVGSAIYIGVLNLVLGVFNMLPGFPMDGGRVLRAIIWKVTGSVTRATRLASIVGEGLAWLLIAYGAWRVFSGTVMGGIWLIFIGWFIRHAARASYRQHLVGRTHQMRHAAIEEMFANPVRDVPGREVGREIPGGDGRRVKPGRDVTGMGGER